MNEPLPKSHNQPEFSVSEISQALKRTVEENFAHVRVRGEISGYKRAASGHLYFSLKDENALLSAVCWKGVGERLPFMPEDGLEVVATGKISTYPGRSNYQLVVIGMEIAGEGALMALLEKRRKQLAAEGLFAAERKRPLPFLPQTIGVVTSASGAVISDILHRIAERFPAHVLVWPVLVQGEGASKQITAAIKGFNAIPQGDPDRPDALIVARGGGSLEDLWAFNEEEVVRAAAASAIPLISAVGHETDTTLIDFASDRRAPTPTAAAEMAVPVRDDLLATVYDLTARKLSAMRKYIQDKNLFLLALSRGLLNPQHVLLNAAQRLDDWSERLRAGLPNAVEKLRQRVNLAATALKPTLLRRQIDQYKQSLAYRGRLSVEPLAKLLERKAERLEHLGRLLDGFSYQKTLERGFALVRGDNGEVVTSAESARRHASLSVQFRDDALRVFTRKDSA